MIALLLTLLASSLEPCKDPVKSYEGRVLTKNRYEGWVYRLEWTLPAGHWNVYQWHHPISSLETGITPTHSVCVGPDDAHVLYMRTPPLERSAHEYNDNVARRCYTENQTGHVMEVRVCPVSEVGR